jgi:hypothetical protein
MFLLALPSRPWTAPQAQIHVLTDNGLGPSVTPQAEHGWEGKNRSTRPNQRPYR